MISPSRCMCRLSLLMKTMYVCSIIRIHAYVSPRSTTIHHYQYSTCTSHTPMKSPHLPAVQIHHRASGSSTEMQNPSTAVEPSYYLPYCMRHLNATYKPKHRIIRQQNIEPSSKFQDLHTIPSSLYVGPRDPMAGQASTVQKVCCEVSSHLKNTQYMTMLEKQNC